MNRQNDRNYEEYREGRAEFRHSGNDRDVPYDERDERLRPRNVSGGYPDDTRFADRRQNMGAEDTQRGWGNYSRGGNPSNWGNENFSSGYEGVPTSFHGGFEPRNPGEFSQERRYTSYGSGSPSTGSFAGRGPKGYVRSDERIREDVNDRLTDHAELDASDIEVRVQNCEVTLTGNVTDRWAKRMAEDVAFNTRGVKDVHNQLRVVSQEARSGTSTTSATPMKH